MSKAVYQLLTWTLRRNVRLDYFLKEDAYSFIKVFSRNLSSAKKVMLSNTVSRSNLTDKLS